MRNEAKELLSRLGKVAGLKFKMHNGYFDSYRFIAVKRWHNKDYGFFVNAYGLSRAFYDNLKLNGKNESCLWEKVLMLLLDAAKDNDVCLEGTGWPEDSMPLLKLDEDVVVLPKGICTREMLEVWLDLVDSEKGDEEA